VSARPLPVAAIYPAKRHFFLVGDAGVEPATPSL
jgi:hypothetical protein